MFFSLRMFCGLVIIIKNFNFINSRRLWLPNLISYLFHPCLLLLGCHFFYTRGVLVEIYSIRYTLALPRCTKHMAKHGQVCFHRRLFANPAKPRRCTTEPVRPLDGINKDVSGAKLLLMTTSVYHVDCACFCPLLKTQHHCLCPNGRCNLPLASHPPPYTCHS